MINQMNYVSGGITPMFGRWACVRETNISNNKVDVAEVKEYLLKAGFVESTPFITDCVAKLMSAVVYKPKFVMYDECALLANNQMSPDAVTLQIKYYILKNYDNVRAEVIARHGVDIGKHFCGAKNFIKKLANVFFSLGR